MAVFHPHFFCKAFQGHEEQNSATGQTDSVADRENEYSVSGDLDIFPQNKYLQKATAEITEYR